MNSSGISMSRYRYLTHRHAERILKNSERELEPGEIKLHSYYVPSLQEGKHTVKVSQDVTAPEEKSGAGTSNKRVQPTSQDFIVVAPQFSLPPEWINSAYPPAGEGAEARVLPHIVFNDHHLPWE